MAATGRDVRLLRVVRRRAPPGRLAEAAHTPPEVTMDVTYLGLTVLFFALSLALVELCDRL